jgi:hypothetical protein
VQLAYGTDISVVLVVSNGQKCRVPSSLRVFMTCHGKGFFLLMRNMKCTFDGCSCCALFHFLGEKYSLNIHKDQYSKTNVMHFLIHLLRIKGF